MKTKKKVYLIIAVVLLYFAIFKDVEPYLLIPIAFGMLLVNLPLGEVFIKITPKVIGNQIVTLDTFEKALMILQDEAGKFKPSTTVIELQEDRLIYRTDKLFRVERPFGVFVQWSEEGGIDLDNIVMRVSGVYRLLRNKFIVDQNLIINNILQFIKESDNLVLQG